MPRKAKPVDVAEERQPALFLPSELPQLPELAEAAKRFVHTGKIVTKNEERAAAIASKYLESGSLLATSRWFHCSPNTVKTVVDVLEQAGKLDELKQRLSRKLGLIIELTSDRSIEALEAGKVPPNVLPIMLGVAVEKKALIDGEATQRVESVQAAPLAAQDVLAYLARKGIAAPAIDVASTVSPLTDKQLAPLTAPQPAQPHKKEGDHPTAGPGAGGGESAGPAPRAEGLAPEIIGQQKEVSDA